MSGGDAPAAPPRRGRRAARLRTGAESDGCGEEFDVDDYDDSEEGAELASQYASAAAWRAQLVSRAGFPPPPPLPDA